MNELTDGKTQTIKIGGTTYEIERMLDLFDDDKTTVMGDIDQTTVKINITAAPCVAPRNLTCNLF